MPPEQASESDDPWRLSPPLAGSWFSYHVGNPPSYHPALAAYGFNCVSGKANIGNKFRSIPRVDHGLNRGLHSMSAAELHNPALGPSAAIHNKNVPPYDFVSCDVAIFNNIIEDGTHGGNSVCCIYVEVVFRLVSDRKISAVGVSVATPGAVVPGSKCSKSVQSAVPACGPRAHLAGYHGMAHGDA